MAYRRFACVGVIICAILCVVMEMDLPKRKQNRLREYDYSTAGAYFVTICTHERRNILCEIVGDGSPVPKPIGLLTQEMIEKIHKHFPSVQVDKYVIMPNHIDYL